MPTEGGLHGIQRVVSSFPLAWNASQFDHWIPRDWAPCQPMLVWWGLLGNMDFQNCPPPTLQQVVFYWLHVHALYEIGLAFAGGVVSLLLCPLTLEVCWGTILVSTVAQLRCCLHVPVMHRTMPIACSRGRRGFKGPCGCTVGSRGIRLTGICYSLHITEIRHCGTGSPVEFCWGSKELQ